MRGEPLQDMLRAHGAREDANDAARAQQDGLPGGEQHLQDGGSARLLERQWCTPLGYQYHLHAPARMSVQKALHAWQPWTATPRVDLSGTAAKGFINPPICDAMLNADPPCNLMTLCMTRRKSRLARSSGCVNGLAGLNILRTAPFKVSHHLRGHNHHTFVLQHMIFLADVCYRGLHIKRQFHVQAVNFFSFDMFRKTFTRLSGGTLSNEARLTAGALAGTHIFPLVSLMRLVSRPEP